MAEFIEIIEKDPNIHNEISQTINKYNNESFLTRSRKGQNVLFQSKFFKQAIKFMGETISDMDIELEKKDNKKQFSEAKIGITDSKNVDEINRKDLKKYQREKKEIGF